MLPWFLACTKPEPVEPVVPPTIPATATTADTGEDCGYRQIRGQYVEALDGCLSEEIWDPADHATFHEHVLDTAPEGAYPAWNVQGGVEEYLVRRCPGEEGGLYDQVHEERWTTDDGTATWAVFDAATGAMLGKGHERLGWHFDDYYCCEGRGAPAFLQGAPIALDCRDPAWYRPDDFGL